MSVAGSERLFTLPGGYLDREGVLHREAELAPLTGREEEHLAGAAETDTAERVTEILCRCVRRIGEIEPVSPEVARALLVADRQFLLLRLRELTFGERVEGTLACPWPDCSAKVDIDFSTRDIPVQPCDATAAAHRLELSAEAALENSDGTLQRTLTFRVPNGEDEEVVGPVLAVNPARALTLLLERCILGTDGPLEDVTGLVARLSPTARSEVERAMEEHAPVLDLEMDLVCPECGRTFSAPLDLKDFFFGELRTTQDLLYRQVHYIAYHYHWSEGEILDLPREKRLTYIDILTDEIEALNDAL